MCGRGPVDAAVLTWRRRARSSKDVPLFALAPLHQTGWRRLCHPDWLCVVWSCQRCRCRLTLWERAAALFGYLLAVSTFVRRLLGLLVPCCLRRRHFLFPIFVRDFEGRSTCLSVHADTTVAQLFRDVEQRTGLVVGKHGRLWSGRTCLDDAWATVSSFGLGRDSTIELRGWLCGGNGQGPGKGKEQGGPSTSGSATRSADQPTSTQASRTCVVAASYEVGVLTCWLQ